MRPSQADNPDAAARLKEWLAKGPQIPRFRRQANKAEICRQVGISRSTAGANPEVRAILADLDRRLLATYHEVDSAHDSLADATDVTGDAAAAGKDEPLQGALLAVKHLLVTGRVIR